MEAAQPGAQDARAPCRRPWRQRRSVRVSAVPRAISACFAVLRRTTTKPRGRAARIGTGTIRRTGTTTSGFGARGTSVTQRSRLLGPWLLPPARGLRASRGACSDHPLSIRSPVHATAVVSGEGPIAVQQRTPARGASEERTGAPRAIKPLLVAPTRDRATASRLAPSYVALQRREG